ncbi:MAG TPA: hypothetical protein VGC79_22015 [Polyangiaceae bacterium]
MKFALPPLLSNFPRGRGRLAFLLGVLLFCTAPTPGDVGGCGPTPAELDPDTFFASKANIDCQRCQECSLTRVSCQTACEHPESYPTVFPVNCVPLVHDGEVCLRALLHASCDDYASYMSDSSPSVPTECNFCPEPAP